MATSSIFLATDGDGYELTMGRWSRKLAQPFLEFVAPSEAARVLDVGCGTGHLAGAVAARLPSARVQAVDLSAACVASARTRYPGTRLQFRVGDACALDFPDRTFDCVQQFLRHKSAKAEFRSVFWGTVAVNVVAFVVLCSPVGRSLWAAQ